MVEFVKFEEEKVPTKRIKIIAMSLTLMRFMILFFFILGVLIGKFLL